MKKVWKPIINDKAHTVEVKANGLSGSGELLVNGKIVDAWGPSWASGGARQFEVEGKPAILKSTLFSYDLIIDGQKVKR